MKERYSKFILFIAGPVLIFALGILLIQAHLRKAITSSIENIRSLSPISLLPTFLATT
jgi:hypothetical protein